MRALVDPKGLGDAAALLQHPSHTRVALRRLAPLNEAQPVLLPDGRALMARLPGQPEHAMANQRGGGCGCEPRSTAYRPGPLERPFGTPTPFLPALTGGASPVVRGEQLAV